MISHSSLKNYKIFIIVLYAVCMQYNVSFNDNDNNMTLWLSILHMYVLYYGWCLPLASNVLIYTYIIQYTLYTFTYKLMIWLHIHTPISFTQQAPEYIPLWFGYPLQSNWVAFLFLGCKIENIYICILYIYMLLLLFCYMHSKTYIYGWSQN